MRYVTKGELLEILAEESNSFTMFLMAPESFGVVEPLLTAIRIAKQKFDWTNGINLDLPEVSSLISTLLSFGVISQESHTLLSDIIDSPKLDSVVVQINALDDVTVENVAGVIASGKGYIVDVHLKNISKGTECVETLWFDTIPGQADIAQEVLQAVRRVRIARV